MATKATFRMVYTSFWNDERVMEEMTPEDRYFYLYLLTNPHTRQIGVYYLPKKMMGFELGYSPESVNALVDRFENYHKLIKYNKETREIAILNWGKHNSNKGGKPVIDCLEKEFKQVKDVSLVALVAERISESSKLKDLYNAFLTGNGTLNDSCSADYDTQHDTSNDSSTLSEQPITNNHEPIKQQEKEKDPAPPAPKQKVVVENIAIKFYEQNFGLITPFIAEDIVYWCDDLSQELVVKAMQIALEQNKRNMAYVKSILRDWHGRGLTTLSQVEAAQREFEQNRQKQQASPLPVARVNQQPEATKQLLQKQEEWEKDVPSEEELKKFLEQHDWTKK